MVIGAATFVDGSTRLVFETGDGRQFVFDDDGQRVYGVWYRPKDEADEPIMIEAKP